MFALTSTQHNLFYHSGASEGINSVFKGLALNAFKEKRKIAFFFSTVDHAAVYNLKSDLESLGHSVHYFEVCKNGEYDQEALIGNILKIKSEGFEAAINYTYVNNETGVVWSLERALTVKAKTNAFVHVDAVQLVGKIYNWKKLESVLDAYTFSGHKFGSLKGVGFTFLKKNSPIDPLISGGNQQNNLRAGTENVLGIYSLKLALLDFLDESHLVDLACAKKYIEENLIKILGEKGEVVAYLNPIKNLNTIFVLFYGKNAETLSTHFDLCGIDVSTGSACSSGIINENRVLVKMGYTGIESRSAIRFSFSPFMNQQEAVKYLEYITKTIGRL